MSANRVTVSICGVPYSCGSKPPRWVLDAMRSDETAARKIAADKRFRRFKDAGDFMSRVPENYGLIEECHYREDGHPAFQRRLVD